MPCLPRFAVSCGLVACLTIGCQAPQAARLGIGNHAAAPAGSGTIGTQVNGQFYRSIAPAYRPGMRWDYVTRMSDAGPLPSSADMSLEVVEVKGDAITLKLTVAGRTMQLPVTVSDNPMGWTDEAKRIDPALAFRSEGTEDVVVPAGRYVGAAKISAEFYGHKVIGWYVQGVGLVKSSASFMAEGKPLTTTTELKAFSTGNDSPTSGASTQTVLDGAFFTRFAPPLKKGLRRTFKLTGTETAISPTGEVRTQPQAAERLNETIAVSGDRYIVREQDVTTSRLIGVSTFEARQNPLVGWLMPDASDLPFRHVGREAVTVGAGTFLEAEKLTASRSDLFSQVEMTAWLAPGVGVVKATLSAGGSTQYGNLESQATWELVAIESPDAASSSVMPSAFESGGRLSLDGSPVPTRGRFVVEDISAQTDIVFLRCGTARGDEPASRFVVDVELLGAQKTPEGFTLTPQQARVGRIQLWKETEGGPHQQFDVQPGTLELKAAGDKLTGQLTFDVRSYEIGGLSQAIPVTLDFDVFDRHVSR